ncbi:hypothetical protein J6590_004850 [Homalodisca vitripennis]|nr:hypothetical protein J6590_004850 [Homalodisca vitripennis]
MTTVEAKKTVNRSDKILRMGKTGGRAASCQDPMKRDSGLYLSQVTWENGKVKSVPASPVTAGRGQHSLMPRLSTSCDIKSSPALPTIFRS